MVDRVVVTGMGFVTSLGIGKEQLWHNIVEGKSGISRISSFDVSNFPCQIAGEATNFEPSAFLSKREIRKLDRFIHFGVAATQLALKDSELEIGPSNACKVGMIVSSNKGGSTSLEKYYEVLCSGQGKSIRMPLYLASDLTGYLSIMTGAKGPISNIATASTAGTQSIGEGYEIIKRGDADVMVVGASEATITRFSLARFCQLKLLSTQNNYPEKACKPFDAKRDGMVISEGAAVIVLESLNHASNRDANILAEVASYSNVGEAWHPVSLDPSASGAQRVMTDCIVKAGIALDEVGYINAHGTATIQNDKYETLAIKRVFGSHAYELLVSSTKSATGHLLGASGALEFGLTVLAVVKGLIPPTLNYSTPDSDCDLDYVPNNARSHNLQYALSNSFGFGGYCSSILVKKFTG